jgi:hypothetical protein
MTDQASPKSRRCATQRPVAAISSPARKPISAVTMGPNSILPQMAGQPRSVFYAAQFCCCSAEYRRAICLGCHGWACSTVLLDGPATLHQQRERARLSRNAQSRIEQEVTEGTEDSACENSNLSVISVTSCSGLSFFSLLASHVSTAEPKRLSSGTRSKLPDSLTQSCGRGILTAIQR